MYVRDLSWFEAGFEEFTATYPQTLHDQIIKNKTVKYFKQKKRIMLALNNNK